jgi:hypothetical protein
MMRFQWNALSVGRQVFVHDSDDPGMRLLTGTVTMVDAETRAYDNEIDIRVDSPQRASNVRRPPRLTVHLRPLDPVESAACWRCEMIEGTAASADRPLSSR